MRRPLRPADLSLRLASDGSGGFRLPGELSDSYGGKNVSGHDSDVAIIGEGAPPEAQEAEAVLVDFGTGRRDREAVLTLGGGQYRVVLAEDLAHAVRLLPLLEVKSERLRGAA